MGLFRFRRFREQRTLGDGRFQIVWVHVVLNDNDCRIKHGNVSAQANQTPEPSSLSGFGDELRQPVSRRSFQESVHVAMEQ